MLGDVQGKLRHCILEPADVRPLAMSRTPERGAAKRADRRVALIARQLVQHVLRDLVRMAGPTRPDWEAGKPVAGSSAGVGRYAQSARSVQQQIGHVTLHTRKLRAHIHGYRSLGLSPPLTAHEPRKIRSRTAATRVVSF